MTAPVAASELDLRTLAGIISDDRADLPAEVGLPPSLLADLMSQIRCDVIVFAGFDSGREETWFSQAIPDCGEAVTEDSDPVHWPDYWHCQSCRYPDRTGDLRSIVNERGLLFGPAMAFHPLRHLPADGVRTRSDADPARHVRPGP